MSIANLITENTKQWQDLKVNSIESQSPLKFNIEANTGLTLAQGSTYDTTESAVRMIFSTCPNFPVFDPLSFNVNNDNIQANSIIIPSLVIGAYPNTFNFDIKTDSTTTGQVTFEITNRSTNQLQPSSLEMNFIIINNTS